MVTRFIQKPAWDIEALRLFTLNKDKFAMLRSSLIAALLATTALPAFADDVSLNPLSAPKGKYKADPNHTSVLFCIRHNGISDYCGRFNGVTGTLTFSGNQPEKSTLNVEIDVNSIDTPSDRLDTELKTNFFETAKFPTATFKSTSIKVTGKNEGEITGDLTLHGVTKPVTLKATYGGGKQHPLANTYVIGFSGSTKFNHTEFGFPSVVWRSFIGDEVTLYFESELQAEK